MKTSLHQFALLLLLCSTVAPPAVRARPCGESVLREGALPSRDGLRLGPPAEFDDGAGIQAGRCFPLYAGRRLVTWLHSYHLDGSRLYVRRCVEARTLVSSDTRGRPGWVEDVFEELRFDGRGRPRFVKFVPPLWSELSNPSFCHTRVAYWGTESRGDGRVVVHAVLFSLSDMRVVRRALVGQTRIESDSRDFFAPPRWGAGGRSVVFDPPAAAASNAGPDGLKRTTLRLR